MVNEIWNVTHFEHSIGVMLLIRIVVGSIEEQIARLLHDVSHKITEIFLSSHFKPYSNCKDNYCFFIVWYYYSEFTWEGII